MANIFTKQRRPVLEFIGQIMLLASFVAAIAHGVGVIIPVAYGAKIIAALPAGFLLIFTLINTRTINHILLALALAAIAVGNILTPIDLSQVDKYFWFANIGYLSLLLILFGFNRKDKHDIHSSHLNLAGSIIAITMGFVIWIFPKIDDGLMFFAGYGALLLLTTVAGILSNFYMRFVVFGIIAFGVANGLLITLLTTSTPDYFNYIIWALTYLSEILVTLGVILMEDRGTGFGKYRFD